MSKDLTPAVKGTRDFYPEEMAFRKWLFGIMRDVSESFGYQEFDGPEIEYLDLYAGKTSEEILSEQAFMTQERDGTKIMLRPEITPTFARMVAQKSRGLLKPVRWYAIGRCWRYEKPQRGRAREFFQWELNILGPESAEADAEILAILATFFQKLGLTPEEVVVRVNDRSYFEQVITENGISADKYMPLLRIVDRKEKISTEEFNADLRAEGLSEEQVVALNRYFDEKDYSQSSWLSRVFTALESYPGVSGYIVYDPTIARGLDYYTRTVFEAWDKTGNLRRALFGGGRFDNLTAAIGGERVPGVGYAVGDMGITEVLEQFGKKPDLSAPVVTLLVSVLSQETLSRSIEVVSYLRSAGVRCELWSDAVSDLGKQLKYANNKKIPYLAIIGEDEISSNTVVIKDMLSGEQSSMELEAVAGFIS